MPENNVGLTTTTLLNSQVPKFSMPVVSPDSPQNQDETFYDNPDFLTNFSYYKGEAPLKKSIDVRATYAIGKGVDCDPETRVILDHISGNGKETYKSVLWNALTVKQINDGGSFTQIIRNKGERTGVLLNLKPLNPAFVRVVYGRDGRIKHYLLRDPSNKFAEIKLERWEMLHLQNDRVVDEMGGTGVVGVCKWIIDARREAMEDWRRISHRSTIRILYIDVDNSTRLTQVREQYKEAIAKGEVLILPLKKGDAEFADLTLPPVEAFLAWIRYNENLLYQATGVPKVVLGGSEEFTEASSKTAVLTFNQVWDKDQSDLEDDFLKQVGLRIICREPISLRNELISDEKKNTGQTTFQPNDVTANSGADGVGI